MLPSDTRCFMRKRYYISITIIGFILNFLLRINVSISIADTTTNRTITIVNETFMKVDELIQFLSSINPYLSQKSHMNEIYTNMRFYVSETNKKTMQQILIACMREKILKSHYHSGRLVFQLPRLKSTIYVNEVNLNSLFRFNGYNSILFVRNTPVKYIKQVITDPTQLLSILKQELCQKFDSVRLEELFAELDSHTQNAILANWQKYEVGTNGFNEPQSKSNISRHSEHLWRRDEVSSYSFKFEKFVTNGNLDYLFPKTKVGFSLADAYKYSPEFQPKVFVLVAAVHKSVVGIKTIRKNFNYVNWFSTHFSETWSRWISALNQNQLHPEDYLPFPVHPWQFTHYVEKVFARFFKSRIMVLPENVTIEMSPTASYRTLMSTKNLFIPYIKLPVSIKATSALRTLPVKVVRAAPVISQLLKDILAKETQISNTLNIMQEDIGVYLNIGPESGTEHLSVIFRENVISCCLTGEEIAVVVCSLYETMPATNTSLYVHFMERAGYKNLKSVMHYFTKYVDLVLRGYLDLYLMYGIALEGHQQNTLAVFDQGQIKRFIARDLTGICIHENLIRSYQYLGNISRPIVISKQDFVGRIQLLDTVYQAHLGNLVLLLADHFNCDEKLFWNVVRNVTENRFKALEPRVDRIRWKNEYEAILMADWPVRSYLRMRLTPEYPTGGLYDSIKNPLI